MWFTFHQNNSGGAWDENFAQHIVVEANDADHAVERAENIGLYFNGVEDGIDCSCCGDRWYRPYGDGDDSPRIYAQKVADFVPISQWPLELFKIYPIECHPHAITEEEWKAVQF